jgi:dTDP-4-amino-4,6-dideoxy-D-galactose acyltransferase
LAWDTAFWAVRTGRVSGLHFDRAAVEAWAAEHAVECLYFLAPSEGPAAVRATDAGFRPVDVRVTLGRATHRAQADVRPAQPDDAARLREIARVSHRTTRFYADPRFPDTRCDDLYEHWLQSSLDGWADTVLVVERDGRAAGYVTCHVDRGAGTAAIGLVAVAPEARRRGLGGTLVAGALTWCDAHGVARLTGATQGRNVTAIRVFERSGFRTESVALWLHGWYDRP